MTPEKKFFSPTLYPRTYDISKKWFVKFFTKDYTAGKLKPNKLYGYLNLIEDVEERKREAQRYIDMLNNNELPPFAQGARKLAPLEAQGNFAVIGKVLTHTIEKHKREFYTEPDKVRLKNIRARLKTLLLWLEKNNLQKLTIGKFQFSYAKQFLSDLIIEQRLSVKTRNNYKTDLTLLWNLLIEDEIVKENPWKLCQWMKATGTPFKKHSENIQQIIQAQMPHDDIQLYIAIWFIYGCYMRVVELSRIKLSAIDFVRGILKIDGTVCMKSAGREVPIPLELMKLLKEQQYDLFNEDDYIFSPTGMPGPNRIAYQYLRTKWKKFATKHSIPDKYKLYGLKHTGNTKMVMTGINSRTLQKLNGHSSLEYIQKNYTGELSVEDIMWVRDHQPKLGEAVKPVMNQKDEQTELLKMILEKLSNRV